MDPEAFAGRQRSFFEGWRQSSDAAKGFVSDGAVVPRNYLAEEGAKVLFVLKEAHEDVPLGNEWANPGSWSLCDDWLALRRCSGKTWNNVARWKRVIDHLSKASTRDFEARWKELCWMPASERHEVVREIAIMNVKKAPGRTRSINAEVASWAKQNSGMLMRQLHLLDPDWVVCCVDPSWCYFLRDGRHCWNRSDSRVQARRLHLLGRERTIIWQWHPQASKPKYEMAKQMWDAVLALY